MSYQVITSQGIVISVTGRQRNRPTWTQKL